MNNNRSKNIFLFSKNNRQWKLNNKRILLDELYDFTLKSIEQSASTINKLEFLSVSNKDLLFIFKINNKIFYINVFENNFQLFKIITIDSRLYKEINFFRNLENTNDILILNNYHHKNLLNRIYSEEKEENPIQFIDLDSNKIDKAVIFKRFIILIEIFTNNSECNTLTVYDLYPNFQLFDTVKDFSSCFYSQNSDYIVLFDTIKQVIRLYNPFTKNISNKYMINFKFTVIDLNIFKSTLFIFSREEKRRVLFLINESKNRNLKIIREQIHNKKDTILISKRLVGQINDEKMLPLQNEFKLNWFFNLFPFSKQKCNFIKPLFVKLFIYIINIKFFF